VDEESLGLFLCFVLRSFSIALDVVSPGKEELSSLTSHVGSWIRLNSGSWGNSASLTTSESSIFREGSSVTKEKDVGGADTFGTSWT